MDLSLEKQIEDARGKILIYSYGKNHVNLIEIKKGFARGGHYHPYPQNHIIISGRIEYREENIVTNEEKIVIIDKPEILLVPANAAHLFIALEDAIFVETYDEKYDATNYPKYRNIVEERMNHIS
ncbi:MAG: cupin domain-containing protein [Nitrosotalea sp.]